MIPSRVAHSQPEALGDGAKRLSKLILDSWLSKWRSKLQFQGRDDQAPSLEIVARATL